MLGGADEQRSRRPNRLLLVEIGPGQLKMIAIAVK